MTKSLPFSDEQIRRLAKRYPTPFHIYDESGIRSTAQQLNAAFSWVSNYKNFFAVKALPNPSILSIVKSEAMGVDCSSLAELVLAEIVGFSGEQIMFTSNDTAAEEFKKAMELGAIINLDDISHIQFLSDSVGRLPELICFRFNPGPERLGNDIIGNPAEAKYGLTRKQLYKAYSDCQKQGVKRFGLHTMLVSNELDPNYFIETARLLFELVVDVRAKLGVNIEFINLGGGFGIPYKPDQQPLDIAAISVGMKLLYVSILTKAGLSPKIFTECGRFVTGPHGYLVSKVLHLKHTYRDYVGLDSSMANLMRPAMYGAYHHISVIGKQSLGLDHLYDVTGSLCENNDKFAIQRLLPLIEVGDLVVLHDTGAHGHSMGFNYNGKLRSAELLLKENGQVQQIRRPETLDDYFSTLLDF